MSTEDDRITWLTFDEGELPDVVRDRILALIEDRDMWQRKAFKGAEALGNLAVQLARAHKQLLKFELQEASDDSEAVPDPELGEGLRPDLGGVQGQPPLQGSA